MALKRFAALDLAGRGLLEAFRCAFVRFHFGHIFSRRLRRLAKANSNWQLAKPKPDIACHAARATSFG
jgi:hypothetical protein